MEARLRNEKGDDLETKLAVHTLVSVFCALNRCKFISLKYLNIGFKYRFVIHFARSTAASFYL